MHLNCHIFCLKAPQEVCEPQEITESGTTITSPGYNGNSGSYPNLASCNWTVVAAHNQVDLLYIITHVTTILNLIKNHRNKVVIMVSLHCQTETETDKKMACIEVLIMLRDKDRYKSPLSSVHILLVSKHIDYL